MQLHKLRSRSALSLFGLEDVYTLSYHFGLNMAPCPIPEEVIANDDVRTYLNGVFTFAKHPEAIDRDYYVKAYLDPARRSAAYNYYRHSAAAGVDDKGPVACGGTPVGREAHEYGKGSRRRGKPGQARRVRPAVGLIGRGLVGRALSVGPTRWVVGGAYSVARSAAHGC